MKEEDKIDNQGSIFNKIDCSVKHNNKLTLANGSNIIAISIICFISFLGWFFLDDIQHLPFNRFLLQGKSIFVPNEVWIFQVEAMSLHAAFKQTDDVAVVWILGETKTSAVMHEFLELFWLVLRELLNGCFLLLFLNISILLSLRFPWKTLPWE